MKWFSLVANVESWRDQGHVNQTTRVVIEDVSVTLLYQRLLQDLLQLGKSGPHVGLLVTTWLLLLVVVVVSVIGCLMEGPHVSH